MRNRLILSDNVVYDDSHIYGGVTFNHNVNPSVDIQYGVCAIAELDFVLDVRLPLDTEVTWHCMMMEDTAYTQMGVFYVSSVEKQTNGKYSYKCYDLMNRLDNECSLWFRRWLSQRSLSGFTIQTLVGAISAKFLSNVNVPTPDPSPSYYGAAITVADFTNGNGWTDNAPYATLISADDIKMPNITVRELVGQVCAYIGCFAYIGRSGDQLIFRSFRKPRTGSATYLDVTVPLTEQKENSTLIADYDTPKSDIVQYTYNKTEYEYNDRSVAEGGICNVYKIENNWFINAIGKGSPSSLPVRLQQIYNVVHQLYDMDGQMYRPVSLRLFTDKAYSGTSTIRLDVGNVFQYETPTIVSTEAVVGTSQGLVPSSTPIVCSESYEVLPNGNFRLGNVVRGTLADMIGKTFYTISDSATEDFYNANYFDGQFLYKTTYFNTQVASTEVRRTTSVSREKKTGIVMRKQVTSSGVNIDCTGGERRRDTRVQESN